MHPPILLIQRNGQERQQVVFGCRCIIALVGPLGTAVAVLLPIDAQRAHGLLVAAAPASQAVPERALLALACVCHPWAPCLPSQLRHADALERRMAATVAHTRAAARARDLEVRGQCGTVRWVVVQEDRGTALKRCKRIPLCMPSCAILLDTQDQGKQLMLALAWAVASEDVSPPRCLEWLEDRVKHSAVHRAAHPPCQAARVGSHILPVLISLGMREMWTIVTS